MHVPCTVSLLEMASYGLHSSLEYSRVRLYLQALAELQSQMPNVSDERARQAEAADPRFRTNASVLRLEQLDSSLIM